VGHHDSRHTTLTGLAKQAHDGPAIDRVQRAGRLVGKEQTSVADYSASDRHALGLPTG
jgi:hypothetical protein